MALECGRRWSALVNVPARRAAIFTKRLYMRPAPAVDYTARLMPHRDSVAILLEIDRSDTVHNQHRENKESRLTLSTKAVRCLDDAR